MIRFLRLLPRFIVPLALLSSGCAGSSGADIGSESSPTSPAFDLSGSWSGRFSSSFGTTIRASATLTQSGSNVSGAFRGGSSGCISGGKFAGQLSGDAMSGSVTAGTVFVSIQATITADDQIDGTYSLPASGGCPADEGSFQLLRSVR